MAFPPAGTRPSSGQLDSAVHANGEDLERGRGGRGRGKVDTPKMMLFACHFGSYGV